MKNRVSASPSYRREASTQETYNMEAIGAWDLQSKLQWGHLLAAR